jgi:putative tryptophan/tyrosine transport system substrate-binding protein
MVNMKRRAFITLLGGAAAAWPLAARAQQPAMPVIGYLSARTPKTDAPLLVAFRRGLSEAGYVEGNNVTIEFRWGGGHDDPLPELAADLVRRRVSVIVTAGGPAPALAAKAATGTIPVVFVTAGDPVQEGLVASLSRPGGNVTGVGTFYFSLGPKQLGLMRELVPNADFFGLLVDPRISSAESQANETEAAGRAMGQRFLVLRARTEREIDAAFATLVQQRAGALLVVASPFFFTQAHYLITLAARHSLPAMYFRRELVEAGGLMSYGTSTAESYHQLGNYAGKILSGLKPSELPVIQSTKFEFVINLQSAKALGLTIPPGLLAIADEVIE